jgi:hydroxyethylthiazole kinase-like uncharacterized protein yjeF
MLPVLSRSEAREFDRLATSLLGVPNVVLMENAGRGAADFIATLLRLGVRRDEPEVCVLCGAGNNGGDGYVVARRLLVLGASVTAFALKAESSLSGEAQLNYRAFVASGGRVVELASRGLEPLDEVLATTELVVDAIFGTGLSRPLAGLEREVIVRANAAKAPRVALDLPSGIDADSGALLGEAIEAQYTLTFGAHKPGLFAGAGLTHRGALTLLDIGVPPRALSGAGKSAELVTRADIRAAIAPRAAGAHKASSGRVLIVAGSPGKIGAALLVAQGALRTGAGLVTLAGLPDTVDKFDGRVLEAMTARLEPQSLEAAIAELLASTSVVAIGPGLGAGAAAEQLIERVVLGHEGVVVVDADAITHFKADAARLASSRGRLLLTPHPGELARLLGVTVAEIEGDRLAAARRAAELTRATVLLKGPHTVVAAPGRTPTIGAAGSSALATGGAGDVLTGVIAALAGQLEPFVAAYAGAFVHAHVGERWSRERHADRGLLAHEIADGIPAALAELLTL